MVSLAILYLPLLSETPGFKTLDALKHFLRMFWYDFLLTEHFPVPQDLPIVTLLQKLVFLNDRPIVFRRKNTNQYRTQTPS